MSARTTITLTPEISAVLSRAVCSGSSVKITEKLDRSLYEKVAKVLAAIGGTWNRRAGATVFDGGVSAEDAIADAIATGAVVDLRKVFQDYPSPPPVVDALYEAVRKIAPIRATTVLEPSAGAGNIARAFRDEHGYVVSVCELEPGRRRELLADGFDVVGGDFLEMLPTTPYDLVVANPPFTGGQDVIHVSKMLRHVRPDLGCVVAVMSPAWTFRTTKLHATFRALVEDLRGTWTELPESSFASSGTAVRTGILSLRLGGTGATGSFWFDTGIIA